MKTLINPLFYFCFVLYAIPAHAQPAKVDSVLSILRAGHKQGRVDTFLLNKFLPVLNRTLLTDSDVHKIVNEANRYVTGQDEDMRFIICYSLLTQLKNEHKDKAIHFGKFMLEKIQNSKTPEKAFIRNYFLFELRLSYRNSARLAEGLLYYNTWLIKFKEANDSTGAAICYYVLGTFYRATGLLDRALYHYKKTLVYSDSSQTTTNTYFGWNQWGGKFRWMISLVALGEICLVKGDLEKGVWYNSLAVELNKKEIAKLNISTIVQQLAKSYLNANRLDSAGYWLQLGYDSTIASKTQFLSPAFFQTWSLLELRKGHFVTADSLLVKSIEAIKRFNLKAYSNAGINNPDYYRALIRIEQKKYTEATNFLISDIAWVKNLRNETLQDYKLLADVYDKMGDKEKSNESYKTFIRIQDSLLADQEKFNSISFEAEQQMNEKEISISQLKSENKVASLTRNFSLGMIVFVLLLTGMVYYRYKSKQKANAVLEKTLANLNATQAQLIQSEKMASLGELTAGIAHEIQNPLNFVNNFSELSNELIAEMNEELDKEDIAEAKLIASDISNNLEKINHHGKRADAIVKGMLQHTRQSSGTKEPTNINALADEYMRLSYHGLRAKDSSFNAILNTSYDASIGNINIIPQDIGRVLLNLFNNAFYAVAEKQKTAGSDYQPTVSISTKKNGNTIELTVSDNGNGIPAAIKEKIFQPFFTTKPTGQGTGLGLSLSYDIIKAQGGELKVETIQKEGSVFIISIRV